MNLSELPKIEVIEIDVNVMRCRTSFLKNIHQETAACVFDGHEFFVYGFVSRDVNPGFFKFEIGDGYGKIDFPERQLVIFDTYWSERIELALSVKTIWHKALFTKNGILSFLDGNVIENVDGLILDESYVRKQLEHEHCSICWQKVDFENPVLFHSGRYDFLCEKCWANYHEGRNIDFVDSLGDFA